MHDALQACDGIEGALARLEAEGRRLGIVTAKRQVTVRLAFDVLPWLEGHFEVVVGAEDTTRHKPNPEPLLHALEQLGAAPAEAAYVGDSPFDVAAAKAAGVFAVAVTWGGIHDEPRLAAEKPDAIVHDPEELLAVL
jgi:pyrophosphatase PpaX